MLMIDFIISQYITLFAQNDLSIHLFKIIYFYQTYFTITIYTLFLII